MSGSPSAWMPQAQSASVNGLQMCFYEVGRRGIGSPVIFCHGFPELAFSWRYQLQAFDAAGRWAIAADHRGYGRTQGPPNSAQGGDVTLSDMEHLTADLVGLLDHVQADRGIFVGHDWGGLVGWRMPLLHPKRVAGVAGLCTPFLPRSPMDPIEALRRTFGERNYVVRFQEDHDSDKLFAQDVEKTMRFCMRLPQQVAHDLEAEVKAPGGHPQIAIQDALQSFSKADTRGQFLSVDELQFFTDAFTATGFTGGIDWYRNLSRNWLREAGLTMHVPMPALMITAERDEILQPKLADGMDRYVPDLETHLVRAAGHWVQQEKAGEVSAVLLEWLARRF